MHSPEAFFAEACRGRDEPIVQFIRRILLHAVVVKADEGSVRQGYYCEICMKTTNQAVRLVGYGYKRIAG